MPATLHRDRILSHRRQVCTTIRYTTATQSSSCQLSATSHRDRIPSHSHDDSTMIQNKEATHSSSCHRRSFQGGGVPRQDRFFLEVLLSSYGALWSFMASKGKTGIWLKLAVGTSRLPSLLFVARVLGPAEHGCVRNVPLPVPRAFHPRRHSHSFC